MTLQAFLVGVLLLLGTGSAASAESPDPMSASLTAAVGPSGFGGDWAATRDWGIPPCRCEGVRGPRGWSGPRGPKGKTGARGPKGKAGARGATGAAGTAGATGPSGPAGIVGATGPIGPIGPTGIAGATGPTGQVGVTGETGATGASAQSEYAYIYNLDPEVVPIAADVTFSTNGPIGSTLVSHTPGTATITVNTSGVYEIGFSVSGVEPNQFTIFVNGIAVPGSTYGSGAGTQQNTGVTMVALLAGDAVTLRNFSSAAAVTLQTLAGGTETNVNASMTFLRLSN